ncbi:MAG: hypothetical protein Fur0018_18660 [Anaerolineales bacterium]
MISPVLEKLAAEYDGRVALWKINTDEESALAAQLRIIGIPTVAVYRSGNEITRRTGAQPEPALRELFEMAAGTRADSSAPFLSRSERILRTGTGLILVILGLFAAHSWILAGIGALIAFSGVYDRCPLWRALFTR